MNANQPTRPFNLGASLLAGERCEFVVWAPNHTQVDVQLRQTGELRCISMTREDLGYYRAVVDGIEPNARYTYKVDGSHDRPDPASRYQPEGVHGPSEVVDLSAFRWTDAAWKGIALEDSVFYELHVGTYTTAGTYAALIPHLTKLKDLG